MILRFFLFFSFLISRCIGAVDFSIDFFNVGQGNCTVVYFGKNRPLLIVDAGSSAEDRSHESSVAMGGGVIAGAGAGGGDDDDEAIAAADFKTRRIRDISDSIKRDVPSKMLSGLPHINVVISHGDIDHCNWMVNLVESVGDKKRVRGLLGGSVDDYSGEELEPVREFVDRIKRMSDGNVYVKDYGEEEIQPLYPGGDILCSILASDTRTRDKNRHSIVLEVGKGPFSAILTGDAPGKVMDEIPAEKYSRLPDDGIRIFQASHHGADSHESNSADLFAALQPHYCVISAGSRRDYGHPRQRMIINSLDSSNIKENSVPHLLQYYSDYSFIDSHPSLENHLTIGRLENDFVVGLTRLGIFSTASQGDIHFENGEFTFSKKPPTGTNETLEILKLIEDYLEKYNHFGGSSDLLSFKLPPLTFSSMDDFGAFLEKIPPNVISCDLSRTKLDASIDHTPVVGLIERLENLRELELPSSLNLEAIKKAWVEGGRKLKNLRFILP